MQHGDQGTVTAIESERVLAVARKLALGHLKWETGYKHALEDIELWFQPRPALTKEEWDEFNSPVMPTFQGWPEVGSRAMHTATVAGDVWWELQPRRYRYRYVTDEVRIVLSEYLAVRAVVR
jgi:hypothetical protein